MIIKGVSRRFQVAVTTYVLISIGIYIFCLLIPRYIRPIAWTLLALSLVYILIAVVGRQVRLFQGGQISRGGMVRRIGFEAAGVLLCAAAVILAASWAAWMAVRLVPWDAGTLAGRLIPLAVSLSIGLGVGALWQAVWSRLGSVVFRQEMIGKKELI
jgi:hypothetical protein